MKSIFSEFLSIILAKTAEKEQSKIDKKPIPLQPLINSFLNSFSPESFLIIIAVINKDKFEHPDKIKRIIFIHNKSQRLVVVFCLTG